ncbi:MAG: tetratricopeptide repeat protein [Thiobacillus sp.]
MSIINQTLRELDARAPDAAFPGASLRPVVAIPNRERGLWAAAGVLLALVGVGVWAMWKPAAPESKIPTGPMQRVAVSPAARPVASGAPPAAAPAPVPAPPVTAAAAKQPVAVAAPPAAGQPVTDAPANARTRPIQPAAPSGAAPTMKLSPFPDEPAPVIRKKVDQPTAEEIADERYRKAMTLVRNGMESEARPLLESAIELNPGHAAAREALAALLSEAGQNGEAEAVLRDGRAVAPDNARFALSLASLQAARGDMEGAAATLRSGIGGRGVDAGYHATLAAVLVRLKRYPEAARQYELALKQQPGQGTWWMGLGMSREAQGKADDARAAYRRALAAGDLPDALVNFVRAKLVE